YRNTVMGPNDTARSMSTATRSVSPSRVNRISCVPMGLPARSTRKDTAGEGGVAGHAAPAPRHHAGTIVARAATILTSEFNLGAFLGKRVEPLAFVPALTPHLRSPA